ncbi:unnamed protein product [Angiostrongylus costaricensis]|uniref:MFS domain-containing protein n=1 Tax=Angiostrongylus costaricensis TaxID=334426 RepID=A0A0R3PNI0_ANGCS|nr:unnamed protein product [Angiostrongylus costaricensis]
MVDPISRFIFCLPPFVRLVVVLTGAVIIHLTIGTYHTFGNMLPYMASYMRNYTDPTIRIEHFMWIPTFQDSHLGCFPFSMVIGGTLALHVGPRMAALIGCAIATSSVALSFWTIKHSFFAFFITYGVLFGFGQGIAYVTAVATVINWAPEKVGLVSGIVAAGFGISSSIFAPIQTHLINPYNLPSTKDGYFLDKDLLNRVPDVFLTLATVYAIMQLIGLIVVCDPPVKQISEELLSRWVCKWPICFLKWTELFFSGMSLRPLEILSSSTFYVLFTALFCCSFYANMFYNLYKTFAETFVDDDFFLARAFAVGSVANAIARIAWGYLTDRTSFQVTMFHTPYHVRLLILCLVNVIANWTFLHVVFLIQLDKLWEISAAIWFNLGSALENRVH